MVTDSNQLGKVVCDVGVGGITIGLKRLARAFLLPLRAPTRT